MGTLVLPEPGLIYLDTAIVIYSVEKNPDYWLLLRPLWEQSRAGSIGIATSNLTLLETLVAPLRDGDGSLIAAYEQLLTTTEVRLLPVTTAILRQAAQLRASLNLKTPDAIHAATALASDCSLFLTNDRAFQRVPALNPLVVGDL